MMDTRHSMQRWTGYCAGMLAVALLAGCQSAGTAASANPGAAAAAAPVATATAAAAPGQPSPLMPHPITPESVPPVKVTPPIRINCGANQQLVDSAGHVWVPDVGFSDGNPYEVDDVPIANTRDPAIFRTERYGMETYRFGVPNGNYTVKLLFAEVYSGITGPGGRVFSVNVQGHMFKGFDIWAKAGGPDKAYVQSVDVEVTDGVLNIAFTPDVENPKIDGIEILPRP